MSDAVALGIIGVVSLAVKGYIDYVMADKVAKKVEAVRVATVETAGAAADNAAAAAAGTAAVAATLETTTTATDRRLCALAADMSHVKTQTSGLVEAVTRKPEPDNRGG